ncbi:hypothetical protein KI387_020604, partial [Taxus chinensis]
IGEIPIPGGASETTMDKEKEIHSTEPPSTIDSSVQEGSSAPLTSQLEAIAVNTLCDMSFLTLGSLATPSSSSIFSWVKPLVDSRKRKSSSRISGPKFNTLAALFGSTPTLAKKARTTSRIVSDAQGQQFLEIVKPKVDKPEKDM